MKIDPNAPAYPLIAQEHPLATQQGLDLFVGVLLHKGAMCPVCFYGTRATSKRWAKCKKCGERVERRNLDALIAAHNEEAA